MEQKNLPTLLNSESIKQRFNEILGSKAPGFISALMSIWQNNKALQNCDARSILGAAGLAATLNLSLSPSLGQAYVVPLKSQATFQIGVKGLVQLAHRSGKYVALHAGAVHEGEVMGVNFLTGEVICGKKLSDDVIGYIAYMELVTGFTKSLYMTVKEIEEHAEKYSISYKSDKQKGWKTSPWSTHFEAMACKTVLKKLLTTWGILSTELISAVSADQAVIDKSTFTYVDNDNDVRTRDEIFVVEEEENGSVGASTAKGIG